MSHRHPVQKMFITFPKSTCDKNTFRDILLQFDPDYYKVCEEKHKDGTPHLHAVIRFKGKYSVQHVLKIFAKSFPDDWKRIDVKPVRSLKHAVAYLSKEDKAPLESGEAVAKWMKFHKDLAEKMGFATVEALLIEQEKRSSEDERLHNQILLIESGYEEAGFALGEALAELPTDVVRARERLFDHGFVSDYERRLLKDAYEMSEAQKKLFEKKFGAKS